MEKSALVDPVLSASGVWEIADLECAVCFSQVVARVRRPARFRLLRARLTRRIRPTDRPTDSTDGGTKRGDRCLAARAPRDAARRARCRHAKRVACADARRVAAAVSDRGRRIGPFDCFAARARAPRCARARVSRGESDRPTDRTDCRPVALATTRRAADARRRQRVSRLAAGARRRAERLGAPHDRHALGASTRACARARAFKTVDRARAHSLTHARARAARTGDEAFGERVPAFRRIKEHLHAEKP